MANPNIGRAVASMWLETLRTTPDPMGDYVYDLFPSLVRQTYRERLDRRRLNRLGQVMSRIDVVRHNLRWFKRGNTMVWRGLNVKDRRQLPDRRESGERRRGHRQV